MEFDWKAPYHCIVTYKQGASLEEVKKYEIVVSAYDDDIVILDEFYDLGTGDLPAGLSTVDIKEDEKLWARYRNTEFSLGDIYYPTGEIETRHIEYFDDLHRVSVPKPLEGEKLGLTVQQSDGVVVVTRILAGGLVDQVHQVCSEQEKVPMLLEGVFLF